MVLLHGVPSARFLYRKVVPELASRGCGAWPSTSRAWARRATRGVRLQVVRAGAMDRRGDRRARDRALPSGRARHRRPDRLEWAVGSPERVLSLTALNHAGTDELPPPLADAPFAVRGPRASLARVAEAVGVCARSSTSRGSLTARRCRAPRSTRTTSCSSAAIAAGRSCGSCAASRSRRRSSGALGGARAASVPGSDRLGERDPAMLGGSSRCAGHRRRSGSTTRSSSPPSTSSRKTRRARSPRRSPISPPRSAGGVGRRPAPRCRSAGAPALGEGHLDHVEVARGLAGGNSSRASSSTSRTS